MMKPRHVLEKRQFGRRTSFASAWVAMPGGAKVPCSVLNISEGGALIGFDQDMTLPPRFTLRFNSGLELDCELRHERHLRAGVEFVIAELQDETAPSTVRARPEPAQPMPASLRLLGR